MSTFNYCPMDKGELSVTGTWSDEVRVSTDNFGHRLFIIIRVTSRAKTTSRIICTHKNKIIDNIWTNTHRRRKTQCNPSRRRRGKAGRYGVGTLRRRRSAKEIDRRRRILSEGGSGTRRASPSRCIRLSNGRRTEARRYRPKTEGRPRREGGAERGATRRGDRVSFVTEAQRCSQIEIPLPRSHRKRRPQGTDARRRGGVEFSTMSGETLGGDDDDPREALWRDEGAPWPTTDIANPGINDCLMGRGGGTNHHPGNRRFRAMTEAKKPRYFASKSLDKLLVAMEIIAEWRALEPPSRFLRQDDKTKMWYDVGDRKAREKTSQALREKIAYSLVDGEGAVVEQAAGAKVKMDSPQDKKGIWTEAEMKLVRDAQVELGNKWNEVAKRVPGRSENSVKNWWYNHQTSEKRKMKKRRRDGEAPELPGDGGSRGSSPAKYNHALIPLSRRGRRDKNEGELPDTDWTSYEEEISPRTVIDFQEASSAIGSMRLGSRHGMEGATDDRKRFESSSDEEGNCKFGAIGYTFGRRLEGDNGKDLGWHVGKVVDVLGGTDKDRKCLYFAIGFIEDLSLDDLTELDRLEFKRRRF